MGCHNKNTMTAINIDDQILDYTEHADGNLSLIFIHGIASSQHTWLNFPLRFARYGRVITLSLPGHYPSRFPQHMRRGTLTDPWVGDIIGEAITHITGRQPALLIGHSTGGYASLAAAWRAPQLVKGVISLAGFARGVWHGTLGMAQQLRFLGIPGIWLFNTLLNGNMRSEKLIDLAWRRCFHDAAASHTCAAYQNSRDDIVADLCHMDARSLRLWFYQKRAVADLTPELPGIAAPILAITGKSDRTVPPSQSVLIAQSVQHGTSILLDGLDHALYMEQPDVVERCMQEWMEKSFTALAYPGLSWQYFTVAGASVKNACICIHFLIYSL